MENGEGRGGRIGAGRMGMGMGRSGDKSRIFFTVMFQCIWLIYYLKSSHICFRKYAQNTVSRPLNVSVTPNLPYASVDVYITKRAQLEPSPSEPSPPVVKGMILS